MKVGFCSGFIRGLYGFSGSFRVLYGLSQVAKRKAITPQLAFVIATVLMILG